MANGETAPTARVGLTVYLLTSGRQLTARQLAERLDITPHGARALLNRLAMVLPLIEDGGVWRVLGDDDQAGAA